MDDLTTLPASVKYQLARAQELVDQNRQADAQLAFRDVAATLARSNPELCGALIATSLGYTDLTVTENDEWSQTSRSEKYLMGVRVAEEVRTTTNTKSSVRKISFSGPNGRGY